MVSELCGGEGVLTSNRCSFLGDILIFMPGQEDIEVTCEVIKGLSNPTS